MVLIPALIFLVSSIVLVKSASCAVKSISTLAEELRFSQFFIAFALAGFVSTLPELFIGINSALMGTPSIGLGTLIGGNIADLTIVLGLVLLVGKKIHVDQRTMSNSVYFIFITALPIVLMLDNTLSRDDGVILVLICVLYFWSMLKKEKFRLGNGTKNKKIVTKHIVIFTLSMIFLFFSARFIVDAGIEIATEFAMPALLIGLLVLALGTTLPELSFSLRAAMGKHKEVALGDLMGNVAIDSTFSIGVIALICPITNNFIYVISGAMFMILSALVVVTLVKAGRNVTWQESFLLIFIYIMFIVTEILIKGAAAH